MLWLLLGGYLLVTSGIIFWAHYEDEVPSHAQDAVYLGAAFWPLFLALIPFWGPALLGEWLRERRKQR